MNYLLHKKHKYIKKCIKCIINKIIIKCNTIINFMPNFTE